MHNISCCGLVAASLLASAAVVHGEEYGPNNLPPCVHPPVMEPVPDGIKLAVPRELANQKLATLGFVDVTAAPFHADATGERDSTAALQRSIDFARNAQMVCFFPRGTYTVSDTLVLRHGIHMRSHRATFMLWAQDPVGSGGVLEDKQRDLQRRWAPAKPGTHPPLQPGL